MSPQRDAFGRPTDPSVPRLDASDASDGRPSVGPGPGAAGPARRDIKRVLKRVGSFVAMALFIGVALAIDTWTDGPPSTTRVSEPPSTVTPLTAPITVSEAGFDIGALRAAMRPGERIVSITIAEQSSGASLLTRGGARRRYLSVGAGRKVQSLDGGTTARRGRGVPITDLDTSAPGRLMEAVTRGLGPGTSGGIERVTASSVGTGSLTWSATVGGVEEAERQWRGDEHGRSVVRTSDEAPAPAAEESGP